MRTMFRRLVVITGRLGLMLSTIVALGLIAASPSTAEPPTRGCGSVSLGPRTLKLQAANLSCRTARRMVRARLDSQGRPRGYPAYVTHSAGCEGIVIRAKVVLAAGVRAGIVKITPTHHDLDVL